MFYALDSYTILTQAVGFLAMGIWILSYQSKNVKGILVLQLFSCFFWVSQYVLLGSITGIILNVISAFRCGLYLLKDKVKFLKGAVIPVTLSIIVIITGVYCYKLEGLLSLLPVVSVLIQVNIYMFKSDMTIRFLSYFTSPCWLVFNVVNGSIAGVINECITLISLTVSIIRFKKDKKNEEAKS